MLLDEDGYSRARCCIFTVFISFSRAAKYSFTSAVTMKPLHVAHFHVSLDFRERATHRFCWKTHSDFEKHVKIVNYVLIIRLFGIYLFNSNFIDMFVRWAEAHGTRRKAHTTIRLVKWLDSNFIHVVLFSVKENTWFRLLIFPYARSVFSCISINGIFGMR